MSKIYRIETWLPKEQAWKIEGYCSEYEDAAVMRLALKLNDTECVQSRQLKTSQLGGSMILRYPRDVRLMAKAEEDVKRMMEAHGLTAFGMETSDWERAFGSSKEELEERTAFLIRWHNNTSKRERTKRREIREQYAMAKAMLNLPYGFTIIWL